MGGPAVTDSVPPPAGDFVVVARCETPTEAHVLQQTLAAAGVAARVADAHLVQAHSWMTGAVGGVRVLVPASLAADAQAVLAEFRAGAFELVPQGPDAEGAEPEPEAVDPAGVGGRRFIVFRHPTRTPRVIAVKKGFSWPAVLVGPLWFLLNGMWPTFFLSLGVVWGGPALVRMADVPDDPRSGLFQGLAAMALLALWSGFGWVANALLAQELERRGYEVGAVLRAHSAGDAMRALANAPGEPRGR